MRHDQEQASVFSEPAAVSTNDEGVLPESPYSACCGVASFFWARFCQMLLVLHSMRGCEEQSCDTCCPETSIRLRQQGGKMRIFCSFHQVLFGEPQVCVCDFPERRSPGRNGSTAKDPWLVQRPFLILESVRSTFGGPMTST